MDVKLKLCKSKMGIEVKPSNQVGLDLGKLEDSFTVIFRTPFMMIISEWEEVIIHKDGNIVFKNFKDEDEILKIAGEIYREAARQDNCSVLRDSS